MKRSDDLFKLIKSLSKEEKRHFKLTATRYGGPKQYLRLFEAIDIQKEYDEDALRRKFRDERFVRQLHAAKSYLYELILGSLRSYHAERSVESRIRRCLDAAEILHARLLYDQARKYVEKARRLAEEHDRDVDLLQVMRWERQLDAENLFRSRSPDDLGRMLERARQTADRAVTAWEHHMHYAKVAKHYLTVGTVRTEEERALVDRIAAGPAIEAPPTGLPFEARISALRAALLVDFIKGDPASALLSSRQLVRLLEGHPECETEYLPQYASALINYLVLCVRDRRYDGCDELVDRLERLPADGERLRMKIFENVHAFRLWRRMHTGRFAEAGEMVRDLEPRIAAVAQRISPKARMFFLYQFAYIRFALGDYRRALDDLLAIERDFPEEVRHDLYCFARLLMLLAHFELGNMELIGYAVRSLYRYLDRHGRLYQFETVLLRYLRSLAGVAGRAELLESFGRLRVELARLRREPGDARSFDFFDFDAWLASKITGRPFGEAVAEGWRGRGGELERG